MVKLKKAKVFEIKNECCSNRAFFWLRLFLNLSLCLVVLIIPDPRGALISRTTLKFVFCPCPCWSFVPGPGPWGALISQTKLFGDRPCWVQIPAPCPTWHLLQSRDRALIAGRNPTLGRQRRFPDHRRQRRRRRRQSRPPEQWTIESPTVRGSGLIVWIVLPGCLSSQLSHLSHEMGSKSPPIFFFFSFAWLRQCFIHWNDRVGLWEDLF